MIVSHHPVTLVLPEQRAVGADVPVVLQAIKLRHLSMLAALFLLFSQELHDKSVDGKFGGVSTSILSLIVGTLYVGLLFETVLANCVAALVK